MSLANLVKNHLDDKDEMLPTNHGFDEFYGKIEEGSISNEIMHHMDWLPTFVAAAG